MSRTRYRYQGCHDGVMTWIAATPIDSRSEHITCSWDWFWGNTKEAGA